MPVCPREAYTSAIIGLTARLAQPMATWFGLAGFVSGPSTLNTQGTPKAERTGPTNRMAGWNTLANANVMPTSSPISATACGLRSSGNPNASRQSAAPHLDDAARLPCLTIFTPAAAATTEPIVDRFTVAAPSPPVPTISVVSPETASGTACDTIASAAPRTSSAVSPSSCCAARTAPTAAGLALPFIRSSTNHHASPALR